MRKFMLIAVLLSGVLSAADVQSPLEITGKGHRFFAADYDKHIMAIVGADGKIEWSRPMNGGCHDAWVLPNGHILWTPSGEKIFDVDPKENKETLLYDAPKQATNQGRPVQIHGFQPGPDGGLVIFESGTKRVLELDKDGKLIKEVALPIEKGDPHHHMRNARKIANGHYLCCLSADSKVAEYDQDGKEVWKFDMKGKEAYNAIRLANGNTLIGGGNEHRVIEVDKDGKEVWAVGETELPGIKLVWVAQVQRLPNGNTIIVNCHAGKDNPQLIEVDKDKKVLWSYRDFQNFGNALPVGFILDGPEGTIR